MDSIGQKMENKVCTRADVTATAFFYLGELFLFFSGDSGRDDRPTDWM